MNALFRLRHPLLAIAILVVAGIEILSTSVPYSSEREPRTAASRPGALPKADSSSKPRDVRTSKRHRNREPRSSYIEIGPDQILATVNGFPIRSERLGGLSATGGGRVQIERAGFNVRLQRAIDAELVRQAAHSRGVELTTAQQRRLDELEIIATADLQDLKSHGMSWHSLNSAQTEFEGRMMEAMMLRQNLIAALHNVGPSPKPEIQRLYEDALHRFLRKLRREADIQRS